MKCKTSMQIRIQYIACTYILQIVTLMYGGCSNVILPGMNSFFYRVVSKSSECFWFGSQHDFSEYTNGKIYYSIKICTWKWTCLYCTARMCNTL